MKSVHFPPGHPTAEGHFPGNPIIPGAVLLREVIAAIAPAAPVEILWAKFHVPVRPGNTIEIQWANTASEVRFRCSIAGSDRPAVTGALGRTSS
jgi:3-hydroxyacyl-[acyl-carrier-protein] dehydratase